MRLYASASPNPLRSGGRQTAPSDSSCTGHWKLQIPPGGSVRLPERAIGKPSAAATALRSTQR